MKIDKEHYNQLLNGVKDYLASEPNMLTLWQAIAAEKGKVMVAWSLFHAVTFDMMFDNHPAHVAGRKRVTPYIEGWTIYCTNDISDQHWQTAMLKILKEVEIV